MNPTRRRLLSLLPAAGAGYMAAGCNDPWFEGRANASDPHVCAPYADAPQREVTTPGGWRLQASKILMGSGWWQQVVAEVDGLPSLIPGLLVVVRDGLPFYAPPTASVHPGDLATGYYDGDRKVIHVGFDFRPGAVRLPALIHEYTCHALPHAQNQPRNVWAAHGPGCVL